MKKILLLMGMLLVAGCASDPEDNGEVDLSSYDTFMTEIGPIDGQVKWTWEAVDMDICDRRPVHFEIREVYQANNSGSYWTHDFLEQIEGCKEAGEFQAVSDKERSDVVDDRRTFYEFRWQGLISIIYSVETQE
jgi:hypothetical protein